MASNHSDSDVEDSEIESEDPWTTSSEESEGGELDTQEYRPPFANRTNALNGAQQQR